MFFFPFFFFSLQSKAFVSFKGNKSYVYSLAVRHTSKIIASGGYDGSVNVFHLSQKEPILSFSAHAEPIVSIDFNKGKNSEYLTGSHDGLVRFWDSRLNAACIRTVICEEQQIPLLVI